MNCSSYDLSFGPIVNDFFTHAISLNKQQTIAYLVQVIEIRQNFTLDVEA